MSKLEIIKQNYVLDFKQNGAKGEELEQSEKEQIDKLERKQLFKQLERALDGVADCVLDVNVLDSDSKVVISNSNFIDFDDFGKIYLTTNYTCFDTFDTKKYVGIHFFKELFAFDNEMIYRLSRLIELSNSIDLTKKIKRIGNSNLINVTEVLEFKL
ncbi:hypothetical protein IHP73_14455 [Enterococcus faecalis]|uniref:hypothetical protein n=1 Tax=Enterococcus TaxID=1350 RepID=UPI00032FF053|nr:MULTISPECIES: hypothetical protein [Enterococcus]EIY9539436.1 hypothetical protein [Enterococcus faecalis]EKH7152639.1 hypothetical protein [Enterococcus faecalis]EKS9961202.1 hypothetical protein [Enterococcus faecalis]EOJ47888.1 hypothetical protein UOE_01127 [Enterococcus faecalis EnGen0285]MBD9763952.1 hypothetical protein [Enterococcus faecalis]